MVPSNRSVPIGDNELRLSLHDLSECIYEIANPVQEKDRSLEDVASHVLQVINESLLCDEKGASSAALLRMFITQPHGKLCDQARAQVDSNFPGKSLPADTICLTLKGTIGDKPEWCTPERSEGHWAIPLVGAEGVKGIPMIARLLSQLGLEVQQVLDPDASLALELADKDFNVFHVEKAVGSQYIPAQDSFVVPAGIKSVVGFGSMLPTGHLCIVIVFSKKRISSETANMFRPLALGVSVAILPCIKEDLLAKKGDSFDEVQRIRAQLRAREQLLGVFRNTVAEQSTKISGTMSELQHRNAELSTALTDLHDARHRLKRYEKGLAANYAKEKLSEGGTYTVAFVVGTFINLYGNFLVPSLRGDSHLWTSLISEFQQHPFLSVLSFLLAYLFPIFVQVYASVKSRIRNRSADMDAIFSSNRSDTS